MVERLAAWVADARSHPTGRRPPPGWPDVERSGFDRLLAEHRRGVGLSVGRRRGQHRGQPEDELAARFATFHLLGAAPDDGEAAVGARGLTGPAYGGHVFWDADVFVLPALAAIRPAAARAMLEYRIRRLPAARPRLPDRVRAAHGSRGSRRATGPTSPPASVRRPHGELIPIRTGEQEEHIVAAVAWAACEYAAGPATSAFLRGPGRDLLLDTARYWASRVDVDRDGRAHLHGVMGPDEYHEVVDDNAYTNVMARWNLRRARRSSSTSSVGDATEAATWRTAGDDAGRRLGSDPRLYEQFAGYWDLEPLLIADVAQPPVAADVLLGPRGCAGRS